MSNTTQNIFFSQTSITYWVQLFNQLLIQQCILESKFCLSCSIYKILRGDLAKCHVQGQVLCLLNVMDLIVYEPVQEANVAVSESTCFPVVAVPLSLKILLRNVTSRLVVLNSHPIFLLLKTRITFEFPRYIFFSFSFFKVKSKLFRNRNLRALSIFWVILHFRSED